MKDYSFFYQPQKTRKWCRLSHVSSTLANAESVAAAAPDHQGTVERPGEEGETAFSEPDRDRLLRRQAEFKAQQGNYREAIALLNLLIARHPNSAIDYNNRGLIYFQSGEMGAAIADYNRAIALNPELASVYNNRANYYAVTGQTQQAIADYEKAIDLDPFHVRARINEAIAYRDLGLYDLAIENFDLALQLRQFEGHIYAERGRTYHLRGDWNCAIADYQRALVYLNESWSSRLPAQVETWLSQLLSPLSA